MVRARIESRGILFRLRVIDLGRAAARSVNRPPGRRQGRQGRCHERQPARPRRPETGDRIPDTGNEVSDSVDEVCDARVGTVAAGALAMMLRPGPWWPRRSPTPVPDRGNEQEPARAEQDRDREEAAASRPRTGGSATKTPPRPRIAASARTIALRQRPGRAVGRPVDARPRTLPEVVRRQRRPRRCGDVLDWPTRRASWASTPMRWPRWAS